MAPDVNSGGIGWRPDGRIVFNTGRSPILEVSDRGGDPRVLLDMKEGETAFHSVSALPEGRGFLFDIHQGDCERINDEPLGSRRRHQSPES